METSYSYIHFLRKEMDVNPKFRETCDRCDLLNILEEEDRCNRCSYCKFVLKLKECLEKNGFFSSYNTVKQWDVVIDNENIEVTPVLTFRWNCSQPKLLEKNTKN